MRFLWYLALVLVAAPASLAAQDQSGVAQTSAGYKVDFADQDIRVVLSALAEAAGLNVTFGDLPQVRTTLHLGQPVPKEQIPQVMRSLAEQHGLAMETDGPLVRIGRARQRENFIGEDEQPKVDLYTYRLKHASAAQIAPLLMNLFVGTSLGGGGALRTACLVNGQPVDCGQAGGQAGVNIGSTLRQPQISPPGDGRGQGPVGDGQGLGRRRRRADAVSQVRVVAEESTNTLLLRATAQEWEWIQKVLQDVDLRPLQVLIEAVIVEVTRTKELNVGVDATVTRTGGGIVKKAQADLPSTPNARDFLLTLTGSRGAVDFAAALNALATRGDLRVRSLPVIVGQNNKQAVLNVGSSRPYVQVTQTVAGQPPLQTVSYVEVGTRLQITPRINADGYVNLELAQTANTATNEIQFDAPVLSKREATTQVFLRDGQTTVIGGLADNTRDYSSSGIPILRSIPIIGGLFGSTHRNDVETELYVFLTPHIIADDSDIDRLRDSLQQSSKELRREPVRPVFPSRSATPAPPDSTPPVPTP